MYSTLELVMVARYTPGWSVALFQLPDKVMSSRLALLPDDIIGLIMDIANEPFEKAARLIQRMLRGTHSRYKLFANVKELTENTYRHYLLGSRRNGCYYPGGSNNTLTFLLDRLKGTYLRSIHPMDGMERYQWEAGYITRHNRVRLRYDANPTMANVASLRGRLREASVHRRYPPKVRAKIFYDDL